MHATQAPLCTPINAVFGVQGLLTYGYVMWGQWVIQMATLLVTWNPICMRFYPRAWVPTFLKSNPRDEMFFDLEAF